MGFNKFMMLMIFPALIYCQSSYLNVSMYDESEFYLVFDNISYAEYGNYAELDQLTPGEHSIKLIQYDASTSAQGTTIFDGKIKIPAGSDVYTVVDEYNSLVIYKKVKYGFNRCECVMSSRKRIGDKLGEIKNETKKDIPDECKNKAIKKKDFDDLEDQINNRNFESTNINIVKTAIDKNYFSSQQVKDLLSYFTFEDSKLDIAKYAYKKVCDRSNFSKVYDAFNFESSVKELKNYISGK